MSDEERALRKEFPHLKIVETIEHEPEPLENGLVYWSTPWATVGLVVEAGVVVEAPPYAKWALGRKVEDLPTDGRAAIARLPCHHISVVGTDNGLVCKLCQVHLTPQGMILSDQQDDGVDWSDVGEHSTHDNPMTNYPEPAQVQTANFPEYPDNPHNHRYTISFTGDKAPMVVVRANTSAEANAAMNELEAYGVWATIAASHAALRGAASYGRPSGPPQQSQPAPGPAGPPFGPNVSVPTAPGYVGPPTPGLAGQTMAAYQQGPPAQQWAPPPPAQQAYGQRGGQNSKPEPQQQPAGWYQVNARSGPDFDAWKAMREQNQDSLKGKVKWAGGSQYWVDPTIAQWIAQQGWAVSP